EPAEGPYVRAGTLNVEHRLSCFQQIGLKQPERKALMETCASRKQYWLAKAATATAVGARKPAPAGRAAALDREISISENDSAHQRCSLGAASRSDVHTRT